MDYVITTEDGRTIVIETSKASESKQRLGAYYNALINKENSESAKKAIDFVLEDFEDEEAVKLEYDISQKDKQYADFIAQSGNVPNRLLAYAKKIKELTEVQKKIAEPMSEVVEKYKNYDFDAVVKEEINGNIFCYRKDKFPIEQFREQLFEMGNKNQGNQWSVSLSDDGRLVIY